VIEHKISFLEELCDRIIVLELGRQIAAGTPSEVWANPAVMAAYLGEAK
jgi:branched-chain amino acid transport system ATP-binding protein